MLRYLRAFVKTMQLALKGELITEPPVRYPRLVTWLDQLREHLDAVERSAQAEQLSREAQRGMTFTLDGRETNVDTVLQGVRYHCEQEYRYLLQHETGHSLMGIYATNLNDQHAVAKVAAHSKVKGTFGLAVAKLQNHLENIPPSNALEQN